MVKAILLLLTAIAVSCVNDGTKLRVGCYYFPGWYCADRWVPIVEYGGREPLLGCYRDDSPLVQDRHIEQATQHGISFWIFDWYYNYKTGTVLEDNAALDKGFLKASLRSKMDFALMWCNEESETPEYNEAGLTRLVKTIGERYLAQPNYLRVKDGRNIFVVSRPDKIIDVLGVNGSKNMLHALNDAAKPWGGLFFACIQDPSHEMLAKLKEAGFDACTLYCYSSHGMKEGEMRAPYDSIIPVAERTWRRAFEGRELPTIPCVSPGWDSSPWYGDSALVRTDSTPEEFGKMCRAVKPFVDPNLGLIVIGTWNEFGEGSYLEPTKERGYGFLDAMQKAFFPDAAPHHHDVSTASEMTELDYADIPAHLEEKIARQGGNLVMNPGFEREWGWVYYDGSPVEYTRKYVHGGERALVLPKAKNGVKSRMLAPGVPWPYRANNLIKLEYGATYRFSVWVMGKAHVLSALFNKQGIWLGSHNSVTTGGQSGEWRKLQCDLTIKDREATYADIEVVPEEETVYVDDVSVKQQ